MKQKKSIRVNHRPPKFKSGSMIRKTLYIPKELIEFWDTTPSDEIRKILEEAAKKKS